MNILITGANGYVGKVLSERLRINNNLFYIKNATFFSFKDETIYLNLLDSSQVEELCNNSLTIDIIIHTASRMASPETIDDMSILYDNIKIYENLTKIAKYCNPKKIINFSSMAVYPNIDGEYTEESVINPSTNGDAFYGLSKVCGENILNFSLRRSSTKIIHLRVGQIYSDEMADNRLYKVMKKELEEKNQITVYGNGERVSNFIHMDTLLEIIEFFIKIEWDNSLGIYNIGENNYSYDEFAKMIIEKYGNKESIIIRNEMGAKSKFILNTNKFEEFRKRNV